jgi:hypothetical protein
MDDESQQLVRSKITDMVSKREYPKTCCPSEVARALSSAELEKIGCKDWREAMDPIRQAAWQMRGEGLLEVTQKGEAVQAAALQDTKGPIRLRAVKA